MIITLTKISPKLWKMTTAGHVQDVSSEMHFPYGSKDVEVVASVRHDYPQAEIRLSTNVKQNADIRALLGTRGQWIAPVREDFGGAFDGFTVTSDADGGL